MPKGSELLPGGSELSLDAPVTKTSSRTDVAGASFQLSWKHAETSSLVGMYDKWKAGNEEDVEDHDDLNQEYRLPTPLNKPTSRAAFDLMVQEDMERKELQGIISNGKKDVLNSVITFSSGLAAQAVDPIALGAGIATGHIFTEMAVGGMLGMKALKAVEKGAKARTTLKAAKEAAKLSGSPASLAALELAQKAVKATAPGIGRRIGEGVVGNVAGEAALVVPGLVSRQQEVDVAESVWNAVAGGVAFPLAIKSLGLSKKAATRLYRSASERINAGKVPFGDARELELTTSQIREQLDSEIKTLVDEQIKGQEVLKREAAPDKDVIDVLLKREAKIEALQQVRQDMELELKKETEIIAKANAPEQDLANTEKSKNEYELYKEKKESKVPITEEAQQRIDKEAVEEAYKAEEALADEAGKLQIKEAREKAKTMRDSVKSMYDVAADCVRSITKGK